MKICGCLGMVLALAAAGCGGGQTPDSARAAGTEPEIELYTVRADAGRAGTSFTAPSTLAVEREADMLAEEDARLMEVQADQGKRVRKGEVLAKLDDSRLLAQLDQDRATLKGAEGKAKEMDVLREGAQVELRRQTELRDSGLGNLRDYDRARFNLEAYKQEVENANSERERARAKVAEDELRLSRLTLRAPFDGIVSRRYARTDEMLLKNEKVLRVTELRPLVVRFTVPEALRSQSQAGAMVGVRLTSMPGQTYRARVARTSYVVDASSGSLECTAQLLEPFPSELVPGLSVEVLLGAGSEAAGTGVSVPRTAVLRQPGSDAVVFVVSNGELRRRTVKLGMESAGSVRVVSGLAAGEKIAAQASDRYADGTKVRAR